MSVPDHDSRVKADKADIYRVAAIGGNGQIVCSRPVVTLVDFYRTSSILAKDAAPKVRVCVACKREIVGTWAYTDEFNTICQECARKRAG